MLRTSISRRLTFYSLLLIILPLLICSIYMVDYFYQININDKTSSLQNQARTIADFSHNYFTQSNPNLSVLHSISTDTDLRITLINTRGTVIYDSSHEIYDMDNHLQRPEIVSALNTGFGSSIRFSKTLGINLLYVAVPVYDNGTLLGISRTALSIAPLEASYHKMRNNILLAFLFVTIISITISIFLTRRFTNPIRQMTIDAKKILNGDLNTRIHVNTNDEMAFFAAIINRLTRRLLRKITESETKAHTLSLILDNMDNAVILLDNRGIITQINKQAKKIFNIPDDILHSYSINCIGSTIISDTAQQCAQENTSRKITLRMKLGPDKAHFSEKTFIVFFAPFSIEDTKSVVCVFHDISLLQEITDRQNIFVTNAAHELSTPLTSIRGFSETLLDTDLQDQETSRHFLNIIYEESCRMQDLVKNMLQLAKLNNEDYRKQLTLKNINCLQILNKITEPVSSLLEKKHLNFITNFSQKEAFVKVHSDLFKQIFVNLIENAIKYTPENGTISLSYSTDKNNVIFIVQDTGIGIAKADLPFIFDRFYRSDKSRQRQDIGGSGVGLSLVKFLVELFDGKISVSSQLDQGTIFTLIFPMVDIN